MYAVLVINRDIEDEALFVFPTEAEASKFEKFVDAAEQYHGWDTTVLYAADVCDTGEQAYAVWKRMQGGLT